MVCRQEEKKGPIFVKKEYEKHPFVSVAPALAFLNQFAKVSDFFVVDALLSSQSDFVASDKKMFMVLVVGNH